MAAERTGSLNTPPSPHSSPSASLPTDRSSKARYRAYLRRRAEEAASKAPAGMVGSDGRPLADLDPNSRQRTRRSRSFWVLLKEFWGMIEGHRVTVGLCIGTVTIAALVTLAAPASTKVAIDYILHTPAHPMPEWVPACIREAPAQKKLWLLGAGLMSLTVLAVSTGIWGRYQMTRMTQIMRASVRRRVFNHTVRLPLHRVYELKSGGAASILREDAGQAADLLFSLMYNPWRAIVMLVGAVIIIGFTDWHLLVGAMALLPAAYFTQRAWIGRIRPLFREVRVTRTMIDSHATEAFGGMRVVRGFVRQRAEAARFIRNNHLMAREELLAWWWSRAIEVVWQILLPAGSVAVLIYCGNRVLSGTMTLGDVMMFSSYLILLLSPLESLSASATGIQAELASLDRILDLMGEPTEFEEKVRGTKYEVRGAGEASRGGSAGLGGIRIESVSFKYPKGQEWVLRDVSLEVPAGSTVALVGPSGAGKTTLCNLVARFYDPTEGSIRLGGRDIREIPVDEYRGLLGIVEQDVFLFDGTVRENIGYARRGVSMEEIRAAARAANADGFIEKLELGYETLIGERGVRLSGGQKQRIAIARAILAKPRILILDEATSNLDTESEALIQESLGVLMGRGASAEGGARNGERGEPPTSFVIAHRLSTIRNADLIVVIDHGRIIERGTHAELIASHGRYWQMLERQMTRPDDQAAALREGAGSISRAK